MNTVARSSSCRMPMARTPTVTELYWRSTVLGREHVGAAPIDSQRAPRQLSDHMRPVHHGFVRQCKASRGYDVTARLGEIRVPTLMLHENEDGTVPYAPAVDVHEGIVGSSMLSLDGGHLLTFSKREGCSMKYQVFGEADGRALDSGLWRAFTPPFVSSCCSDR